MLLDYDVEIGNAIKEARRSQGLGQRDLAGMIGISIWTLSRLEHGRRKFETDWLGKMPRQVSSAVRAILSPKIQKELSTRKKPELSTAD